jgi:membrane protease YdiL (CAAX protease family)
VRDFWELLKTHREVLFVTTVASYSHLHYALYGPPAHLLVLPSLAVAVFLVFPLWGSVMLDSQRHVARVIATIAALCAMGPALQWGYVAGASKALKADASPLVWGCVAGVTLITVAMVWGRVSWKDWGLTLGDVKWWGKPVGALLLVIMIGIPTAVWLFPEFAEFYPRYKPGRTDVVALLQYQVAMGVYMFCWEFFFRGFMLFGVARTLGAMPAILIQASPFFLLHEGKPQPELISSWFGGILMGWLCLKARSIWPSFLLHWVLYSSMEISSFVARRLAEG